MRHVSASQLAVFDLGATDDGLMIPVESSLGFGMNLYRVTMMEDEVVAINSNFSADVNVYQSNGTLFSMPVDAPGQISIGPNSNFARLFGSAFLIPSIAEPSRAFHLLGGVSEPARYCYENAISRVSFSRNSLAVSGSVTLYSSQFQPLSGESSWNEPRHIIERVAVGQFRFDTSSTFDVLPMSIYHQLMREISYIAGSEDIDTVCGMDLTDILPVFPTIVYTFFEYEGSNTPAVRIHLLPEDYLIRTESGRYELRVWCADSDRQQLDLGLTFLSQSAVFIDYQNEHIGFCEPL